MVYSQRSLQLISNLDFNRLLDDELHTNEKLDFDFGNIYIKKQKTYARILSDLIYLEQVYREKYVSIAFYDNWMSYSKYTKKIKLMLKDDLTLFYTRLSYYKESERAKLKRKISSLYYYYFVYQMYANFRDWINVDFFYEDEIERFIPKNERDIGYMELVKESFDKAYESIKLFNEINDSSFLDVEKMEKDIDLLIVDCIQTTSILELKEEYMLYYLQPYKFKGKNHSLRIRRRSKDGTVGIKSKSSYSSSRKSKSTRNKNKIMEKYYKELISNPDLTIKQFTDINDISQSTFYYYKKLYSTHQNSNNKKT